MAKKKTQATALKYTKIGIFLLLLAGISFDAGYLFGSHKSKTVDKPVESVDNHATFSHDDIVINLNEYRLAHNVPQLTEDPQLDKLADRRAGEYCKDPSTGHAGFMPALYEIYNQAPPVVSEDLNAGQSTPREMFKSFDQSPTHRDTLLNPNYGHFGIGFRKNCLAVELSK